MKKLPLRACLMIICSSALTACVTEQTSPLATRSTTTAAYIEGVPGGTITRHTVMLATVKAIDLKQRTLTLVDADKDERIVSVAPAIASLAHLAQGDKIKVRLIEEQVVFVRETRRAEAATIAAEVNHNAKATDVSVRQTRQQIAEVRAVDLANHSATLLFNDGSVRTINVRPDVPLSDASLGKTVVIQTADAIAVDISKP